MAKGLKPLIRYNKRQLDDKQRVLAGLQSQRDGLQAQFDGLEQSVRAEAAAASASPEFGWAFASYAAAVRQQQKQLQQYLTLFDQKIEQALEEIREAFRELKTYEIAQANREEAERKELAHKVGVELDEVALTVTQRRKAADAADDEAAR